MELREHEQNIHGWGYFVDPSDYVYTLENTSEKILRKHLIINNECSNTFVRNKSTMMKVLEYLRFVTLIERIYLIILNMFTIR